MARKKPSRDRPLKKVQKYIRERKPQGGRVGAQAGKNAGRLTHETIEAAEFTAKEISDFTSSFIDNFRKEIRKMDSEKRKR